jgi:phosphopantothenoylcysteine decarboxylase/phosphopantothenate--cysteine ligase
MAMDQPLRDRRVLVGLSGGIAAYKTATLVSRLVQAGASVRVVMTEAATRFITPLTLQSLSGRPVLSSIWQSDDQPESQHIGIARWAELMVIAPASADLIAKLHAGICDDLLSLSVCALPAGTPLLIAPSMNADMWDPPATRRNIEALPGLLPDLTYVGPGEGWQACRTSGAGRMAEPEAIFDAVVTAVAG